MTQKAVFTEKFTKHDRMWQKKTNKEQKIIQFMVEKAERVGQSEHSTSKGGPTFQSFLFSAKHYIDLDFWSIGLRSFLPIFFGISL